MSISIVVSIIYNNASETVVVEIQCFALVVKNRMKTFFPNFKKLLPKTDFFAKKISKKIFAVFGNNLKPEKNVPKR